MARTWWTIILGAALLARFAAAEAKAAPGPGTPTGAAGEYRDGIRAFADGLPQVAYDKMAACLASGPPPELRRAAVVLAAQAEISLVDGAGALALLDREFPRLESRDGAVLFWRAQAFALLGRWEEALEDYHRAGQAAAAAAASSTPAGLAEAARFGCGEALLALRRTPEAFDVFKSLAAASRLGPQARLRAAEIALEAALPKDAAALLLVDPAPGESHPAMGPSLEKKRTLLIGRLRLAQKQTALAEQIFRAGTTQPQGLTERLLAASFWGWTQACLEQGKLGEAEDVLESFVGTYPRTIYLKGALAWLQHLYDRNPQLPDLADLRRWAADTTEPLRQAPSLLLLAHVEESLGRPERAEEVLRGFTDVLPDHPLCVRAALDLAGLQLRENHFREVRAALDQARKLNRTSPADTHRADNENEIDMLTARLSLAENDSAKAAGVFEFIAGRPSLTGAQAEAAAFNAVLGWLRAPDNSRSTAAEQAFLDRFPRSPYAAELALEEGLAHAARTPQDDRNGRQGAAAALRRFLRDNPTHSRAVEGRIALAELAFERPRPNMTAAWHELAPLDVRLIDLPASPQPEAAGGSTGSGGTGGVESDRAAYLAIWLADTPGPTQDTPGAIALAKRFLEARRDSPLAPEVRMKLSEVYFRTEDYSDAETQLELLVEQTPESPLVESALYLAGLAASRSMSNSGLDHAVLLFEKTARLGGPFKIPARLRQAELQKKLGNLQDALTIYKDVLGSLPPDGDAPDPDLESRCAALAGQGETLLMLGPKNPRSYGDAAETFDRLANRTPRASLLWRRQALTQKGFALEKTGDNTGALSAYDDALNASDPSDSTTREPEWTWFYRAGYYAARLLESQSQWQSAIAIYKKLAAADGPLKSDYETRLSRSRLEHFIWEN